MITTLHTHNLPFQKCTLDKQHSIYCHIEPDGGHSWCSDRDDLGNCHSSVHTEYMCPVQHLQIRVAKFSEYQLQVTTF